MKLAELYGIIPDLNIYIKQGRETNKRKLVEAEFRDEQEKPEP